MAEQDNKGFGEDHMHYLVHHAQQFHKSDAFADEVQHHLDNWVEPTKEDSFDQEESHQQQSIDNLASNPGSSPVIPGPPSKKSSFTLPHL